MRNTAAWLLAAVAALSLVAGCATPRGESGALGDLKAGERPTLAGAAGVGFVGPLIQLATVSSVFAFSRDNEREADDVGFELMVAAGYDAHEAPKIWETLLAQRAATKNPQASIFFATHPPTEERVATLKALAEKTGSPRDERDAGRDRLLAATLPFRTSMLRDELRLRRFAATQLLLDRLSATDSASAEIQFFQGELYRLRAESGDEARAIAAYEKAIGAGDAPAEAYRSFGLVLMNARERSRARAALDRYLELRPDATDREMIREYVKRLE